MKHRIDKDKEGAIIWHDENKKCLDSENAIIVFLCVSRTRCWRYSGWGYADICDKPWHRQGPWAAAKVFLPAVPPSDQRWVDPGFLSQVWGVCSNCSQGYHYSQLCVEGWESSGRHQNHGYFLCVGTATERGPQQGQGIQHFMLIYQHLSFLKQ